MTSNNAPDQVLENAIVPSVDVLLDGLEEIYKGRGKLSEFSSERAIYGELLPRVNQELKSGYLEKAIGLGSTATVWVVVDALKQRRALKLPRPRLGKLKDIVRVIRAEGERLASLSHQNVIRIYNSYEARLVISGDDYSFPFYTMEYLEGVRDFSEFVRGAPEALTGQTLISYFRDAMNGIAFLHANGVVHCDVKPGNILIAHGGRRALIADLGFAKHLPRQTSASLGFTEVKHTPDYAHPELQKNVVDASDSGGNVATIARDKLNPKFDLYAFGRSMQEVLVTIRDNEQTDPNRQFGHQSSLSQYQWLYLSYIAKRLLDGIVQKHDDDELKSDVIPGLPDSVMAEIHYAQADDALEDFEKLLQFYNLEGEVPELNPNISTYIQIPHCHVPLTDRIQQIISHPTFTRLAQITQLGFVSVVYPGATHTRFEHVLGTFAHCCEYIRALWYDEENCLFQCVMSKGD